MDVENKSKTIIKSIVLLNIAVCILFAGCNIQLQGYDINPLVKEMLETSGIYNSKIIKIERYEDIKEYISNPEVSNEEINNAIDDIKVQWNISTFSDEFINSEYGVDSYVEFEKYIYERILTRKKVEVIIAARHRVMEQLISRCSFQLDESEVARYSLNIISGYEDEAYLYGITLEEYCNRILEISYDKFFERCYEEGEYTIKSYLIIGAIAMLENISIADKEFPLDLAGESGIEYQVLENSFYDLFIVTDNEF